MRSTFSVSTWTWALAGCLALFLGCRQGEGDRCEVSSDCGSGLECFASSPNNGICRRPGSGAGGSTGQGGTTGTSTGAADASIELLDGAPDANLIEPDTALAD